MHPAGRRPPRRPAGCTVVLTEAAGTSSTRDTARALHLGTLEPMGSDAAAQDSGLSVQRTRARRISREALRERVLREGSAMLGQSGVTASLYHVNMEELIRRVGVPRSSAFAAFGGKEELITELMIQLLQPDPSRPSGFSPSTIAVAVGVLERYGDRIRRPDGTLDREAARAVLHETVRVALAQNVDDMLASSDWQTFMALSASVTSLPPGRRERVTAALRDAEEQFAAAMTEFYAQAIPLLGLQMKPGLAWEDLVTAGAGLVEGIVSRRRIGVPIVGHTVMRPGIDGEPVEWTLAALGYLALVESLTEFAPALESPAGP
jgi:AcrR family transcriptional regulator